MHFFSHLFSVKAICTKHYVKCHSKLPVDLFDEAERSKVNPITKVTVGTKSGWWLVLFV